LTLSPRIRLALLVVVGLLLLWLAWTGLSGGVSQLPQSQTPGQIAQTLTQLGFGLFALLSLLTTFWGRRWNRPMLVAWTASVTLAAGLASVVWGGRSVLIGFVSGAAALLIGLGIAWLLRVAARGLTSA
jgi:hypothetical protein